MIHEGGLTIHGGIKHFTEGRKQFAEATNNSRRGINYPGRSQIIHGGG